MSTFLLMLSTLPKMHGVLSSLPEIFINAEILLSYVSNLAFTSLLSCLDWRAMFATDILPPVLLVAGVLAMSESCAVARHARVRRRGARRARAHL
jgi:hypothetical protein